MLSGRCVASSYPSFSFAWLGLQVPYVDCYPADVPGLTSKNQQSIWRFSFLINLAIAVVVLLAGAAIAVNWGNPIPIHLPSLSLGGKILFGWVVIAISFALLFPTYLAVQSRAIKTPATLRQLGLGTVGLLSKIQTVQGRRADVVAELSRMVGVITNDATHWGPVATFDGFSWGFRLRPSHLPLPVTRVVPEFSSLWGGIATVEQIEYPSLITILLIKLRDPGLSFCPCLASVRSLQIIDYMRAHGIDVRLTDSRLSQRHRPK